VRFDFPRQPNNTPMLRAIKRTFDEHTTLRKTARRIARNVYRTRRVIDYNVKLFSILPKDDRRSIEFWGEIEHRTGFVVFRGALTFLFKAIFARGSASRR
jgi:hypothetical protein